MLRNQKINRKKGNKFEDKVQKAINSGAIWFSKGDLRDEDRYIECKYTDKKGFRISTKLLEKVWNEALSSQQEPFLVIGIRKDKRNVFVITSRISIEHIEEVL